MLFFEAVENWRQRREQKRKQISNRNEHYSMSSVSNIEPSPDNPIKKYNYPLEYFFISTIFHDSLDEPETKPQLPPSILQPTVSSPSTTNTSTEQVLLPNRTESKSPSPSRDKVK